MNNRLINQPSETDTNSDLDQQASYSKPNYKNLPSASKALDKAIGGFFKACMENCHDE